VHGSYLRQVHDLPAGGQPVLIHLAMRRFVCANPAWVDMGARRSVLGSAASRNGWRPAWPRDEAEGVTGRVSIDVLAVEFPCSEGPVHGLG
jgi:hypothetical protein